MHRVNQALGRRSWTRPFFFCYLFSSGDLLRAGRDSLAEANGDVRQAVKLERRLLKRIFSDADRIGLGVRGHGGSQPAA